MNTIVRIACIASLVSACALFPSLAGLDECGPSGCFDGGSPPDANRKDVGSALDAPPTETNYTSCAAAKAANPSSQDGFRVIDPDGPGPEAPFRAWCDFTLDEGGWMLVTPAMLVEDKLEYMNVKRSEDARGGLVYRAEPTANGCGQPQVSNQRFQVADKPAWTRIRLKQSFMGTAGCWEIWGAYKTPEYDPNLIPFDASRDVIRDAFRMGGNGVDAFGGKTSRCDDSADNFWSSSAKVRSATVILRRRLGGGASGLATHAECGDGQVAWEYSDIYVK
ncbi:MAG: fibrinogen-like YCDxxxxGGGW domain-containing protein [Polyangiaceae bacterium]